MTLYCYHPETLEYTHPIILEMDDSEFPIFSTEIPPPRTKMHEVAVYDFGKWSVIPDYRNVSLYSKIDGTPVMIEAGHTPDEMFATVVPIPDKNYMWDEKTSSWIIDPDYEGDIPSFSNIDRLSLMSECKVVITNGKEFNAGDDYQFRMRNRIPLLNAGETIKWQMFDGTFDFVTKEELLEASILAYDNFHPIP